MKPTEHQQLQLSFDVLIPPTIEAAFDPYWDELPKSINSVRAQISTLAPQVTNTVRAQVNSDTAPEHNYPELQVTKDTFKPYTDWVEKYWVKRRSEKYEYYRYCWMEGRKKYRCHISGRSGSIGAINRKKIVESAILDGQSPQEIKHLIRQFTNPPTPNF